MSLLLVRELGDLEAGSPNLERAGHLQILGFQENVRLRVDIGGVDQVCPPDDGLQRVRCLVNLIKCQHMNRLYRNDAAKV